MIDFQSAQGALDRELVRLDALSNLRDALKDIGGLSQAADEARKRLDEARAAEAAAQSDLEKIQQQVDAAKARAASEIAEAQAAADDVLTKAKVAAAAIVSGAKAEAAKIISDAETQTADARKRAKALSDAIAQAGT
jgi:dsDNA-specific endonuclease/ATPase MutS2